MEVHLPDDVLHAIFRHCDGITVIMCRRVCRRWLQAVDSLSDKDWQSICEQEILSLDYIAAHEKHGLSWRDTYKSINSWGKIGSSEMKSQLLCDLFVDRFLVLPKGIVSILQGQRDWDYGCYDAILYYDTESFELIKKEEFDFKFLEYQENEYLIVLLKTDGSLYIIVKETKQHFSVGTVGNRHYSYFPHPSLIGKEVYFINTETKICVSKLKKEDGKFTVETEPLEAFLENHDSWEELIVAFCVQNGDVNILSDEGNKCNIYAHKNADFEWIEQFHYNEPDTFVRLKRCGFLWQSKPIYEWLSSRTHELYRLKVYSHGKVSLTHSLGKTVNIHVLPCIVYEMEHLKELLKKQPDRKIHMKDLIPENPSSRLTVTQLDIIETSNKHKILVLGSRKLFVVEFPIDNNKITRQKRQKSADGRQKKMKIEDKTTQTITLEDNSCSNGDNCVQVIIKKTIQAIKKTAVQATRKKIARGSKKKTNPTAKKRSAQVAKKKTVQAKNKSASAAKKTVKTKKVANATKKKSSVQRAQAGPSHSYSTRSKAL